jgi:quercetin dioxygenase-like cupin family protein
MTPIFEKPTITPKIWGREICFSNSPLYCGKILEFNKNYHGSSHFHKQKTESWYILKGQLMLEYVDDKENVHKKTLLPGDSVTLKPLTIHKLIAIEYSQILEVSTEHKDEDSYRLSLSGKIEDKIL